MKAAVCTAYGPPDVVRILEVPDPVPKPNEVLVRVCATTVSSGDARIRGSNFPPGFTVPARLIFGMRRPRKQILGTELAGIVEVVGTNVTRFEPGDRVFSFSGLNMGCHCELKAVPESGLIAGIPAGFTFEEAASISFGGTTALYFLRDLGKVERGQRVLVIGASGAVGTAAVQLAKYFGARVTGVCSGANTDLVRSLGADDVIDYTQEDFALRNERWDIILDTVGGASLARCRRVLVPTGHLLLAVAGLREMLQAPFQSKSNGVTVAAGAAPDRLEDIAELQRLCERGAFRPVIDGIYPLDRIAEAHARVDTRRKVGSVVVTIR